MASLEEIAAGDTFEIQICRKAARERRYKAFVTYKRPTGTFCTFIFQLYNVVNLDIKELTTTFVFLLFFGQ